LIGSSSIAVVLPMMLAASCATPQTEPAKVATSPTDPGRTPSDFYEYANGTWRAQNPIPTASRGGAAAASRAKRTG